MERMHALRPFLFLMVALLPFTLVGSAVAHEPQAVPPPPYFKQLIDGGSVTFEFYDPQRTPREFPGRTDYSFDVQHHYTLQSDERRRGRVVVLTIRPTVQVKSYQITHTVRLPQELDSPARWDHFLMKHELDHVAISSDPRLRMLTEHLYHTLDVVRREVRLGERIDHALRINFVEEELAARRNAVTELLAENYRLLDKVSRHGNAPIPERNAFFKRLFTKPNLDETGFPYTGGVLDLLKSKAYKQLELPYAWDKEE